MKDKRFTGWGKAIVKQLSKDLQIAYPSSNSFSPRNLWFMRQLYEEYSQSNPQIQKVKQTVSLLPDPLELLLKVPWGHNILIMQRLKNSSERFFYLKATSEFGWTRDVLLNQIKADAYQRQKINPEQHNFNQTLEPYLEEQAIESIKSSYNLEFLGIFQPVKEKELEDKLIDNLENFLLELGYGFTFVGRQYKLTLGENSYFVDLLFFNRKLQCLVTFDKSEKDPAHRRRPTSGLDPATSGEDAAGGESAEDGVPWILFLTNVGRCAVKGRE